MKPIARLALVVAGALSTIAAAPRTVGWNMAVERTAEGGHLLGNPAAKVRLVEYVRYSSPESLRFEREAEGQLRLEYIATGNVSLELRPLLVEPVDLTLAMLAACGPKERFFLNHAALIRSQDRWRALLDRATASQRWRWTRADLGARNRALASDLGLYAVMEVRGYDRLSLDRCLADASAAARITALAQTAPVGGARKVPIFSINGKLLENVTDWAALRPMLDESLK